MSGRRDLTKSFLPKFFIGWKIILEGRGGGVNLRGLYSLAKICSTIYDLDQPIRPLQKTFVFEFHFRFPNLVRGIQLSINSIFENGGVCMKFITNVIPILYFWMRRTSVGESKLAGSSFICRGQFFFCAGLDHSWFFFLFYSSSPVGSNRLWIRLVRFCCYLKMMTRSRHIRFVRIRCAHVFLVCGMPSVCRLCSFPSMWV